MEGNGCNVNHLEPDLLLPPRKRLLAGLKKQNSESTSQCPQGISSCSLLFGFDARINDLIKLSNNGSSMTLVEIAEAAGTAAAAAAKAASVARAAAEEKSVIAAKAIAAAKSALDLVASFSEDSGIREMSHGKNKIKKHVPVQLLYKKNQPAGNCRTDEEFARKLHRAMNSSPRISKSSPGLGTKTSKHKKLKVPPANEMDSAPTDVLVKEWKFSSAHSGDNVPGKVDFEGSSEEPCLEKLEGKASKSRTFGIIEENNGEAEPSHTRLEHI